jgi:protocatechuate 3,4-dioxygenase beta subunit
MTLKIIIVLAVLAMMSGLIIWNNQRMLKQASLNQRSQTASPIPTSNCVPTFVDGGGPYYQPSTPFRQNLAPETNQGQKLIVSGKVMRSDCQTPMPDVVLDLWQANETGSYEDEWYRGRITTSESGSYTFESVLPQGYGQGTAYRPPHIHFKVWDGKQEIITSQMFLPAARDQRIEEAYIVDLETKEEVGQTVFYATHNIILPI